jgi:hypothetical protein
MSDDTKTAENHGMGPAGAPLDNPGAKADGTVGHSDVGSPPPPRKRVRQKGNTAGAKFDAEQIADVLIDALILGDVETSKKWGITLTKLHEFQRLVKSDAELQTAYAYKSKAVEEAWNTARLGCLRALIVRVQEIAAVSTDIPQLANAIKVLGELQVVGEVLNSGRSEGTGTSARYSAAGAKAAGAIVRSIGKLGN